MIKSLCTIFTIEKEIENNQNLIYEMKLFNEDKLIIIDKFHFSIYDLLTVTFILRNPILGIMGNLISCKTEIIGKNKIMILFGGTMTRNVIIYQFLEDKIKNLYKLIQLTKIALPNFVTFIKTIYFKNKIIIIGNASFYIYEYENNNPTLLLKIKNNPYNRWENCFKFNKEIIGLLEGNHGLIHFYNIKKGTLIQQNILYNDYINYMKGTTILILNDNDRILYGIKNRIFLYSFKKNKILKKIEDKYNINCLTLKDNKIYFLGPYINKINIETKEINRISLYQNELSNHNELSYNLIFYQNKIISNFKDKIIIFNNNSIKRTLLAYIKSIKGPIVISLIIIFVLSLIFYYFFVIISFILKVFGYNYFYKNTIGAIDTFIEEYDGGRLKKYLCWIYTISIIFQIYIKFRQN